MKQGVIAFDMDGVLVEVGDSYRETIVQTVAHFSGAAITRDQIQVYKNAGGWNNDWALSQKILADLAVLRFNTRGTSSDGESVRSRSEA